MISGFTVPDSGGVLIGDLSMEGIPAELYATPTPEFAADFIGVNNILRGVYEGGEC
jgi:ABC-type Fe3+/spermidine/putrescine transport system ATPase subunit